MSTLEVILTAGAFSYREKASRAFLIFFWEGSSGWTGCAYREQALN